MPTRRNDLLYPELSYVIVGCAFDVYNELGAGHHEKVYQRALAQIFTEKGLKYNEQTYFPLKYHEKIIGKCYLDFLINEAIVVEIKKGNNFSKRNIEQVLEYMKTSKLKLAILINFGTDAVSFKRIVNFDS